MKRAFDIAVASIALLVFGLPLLAVAIAIRLDSHGPALFRQIRVGRFGKPFRIVKFRTMMDGPRKNSGITVSLDDRVTRLGRFLRAAKIDELPQFLNVLRGDMSIVGPRPELPDFVTTYSDENRRIVLSVRPGMTDFASIVYIRETELLAGQRDPLAYYQGVVLPHKLAYCRFYVRRASVCLDLYLIGWTVVALAKEAAGTPIRGARQAQLVPAEPERLRSPPTPPREAQTGSASGRGAVSVAIGILCSRVAGLIRQRVLAHYFGLGPEADAWSAAFRIPMLIQNGFDNQALSASFIPVYGALVARGDRETADRVAGAVAALLALGVAVAVLLGVIAAPVVVELIAPGFTGDKRELTTRLVRVLFPGTGLIVLSSWCVGVLNAHGRFLLPYLTAIVWNAAMIAALVAFGGSDLPRLAMYVAWGAVAGGALQLMLQLPGVFRVAPHLQFAPNMSAPVRAIARTFAPILLSRGVDQIGAYLAQLIASLLGGAVAAITNVQMLSTLPISLFGISVSSAELPALSALGGTAAGHEALRARLDTGLRRIAVFVVPSAMAFLALGDVIAALVFQTGRFTQSDAVYMWGILAGSAVGLLASSLARLYASASYALGDARTPMHFAIVRLALTAALGYASAIPLPALLGLDPKWGAAGLTASAGLAGWVEMILLRRSLGQRIGGTRLSVGFLARIWLSACAGAVAAWGVKIVLPFTHPTLARIAVLGVYGLVFFAFARIVRVAEPVAMLKRLLRTTLRD